MIIGTATYALPTWLLRKFPDSQATTPNGQNRYGPRQIMAISNPHLGWNCSLRPRQKCWPCMNFPLGKLCGRNGKPIHYYFNYSAKPETIYYPHGSGTELLSGKTVAISDSLQLAPWDVLIIEEKKWLVN